MLLWAVLLQQADRSHSLSTARAKEHDHQDPKKVKILFFGSDSFSVPHLEALLAEKGIYLFFPTIDSKSDCRRAIPLFRPDKENVESAAQHLTCLNILI